MYYYVWHMYQFVNKVDKNNNKSRPGFISCLSTTVMATKGLNTGMERIWED
jgi:hypothetical protein